MSDNDTPVEQTQEVHPVREIVVDPRCCGELMAKMVVGATMGKPRYQYACRKCNTQKVGPSLR